MFRTSSRSRALNLLQTGKYDGQFRVVSASRPGLSQFFKPVHEQRSRPTRWRKGVQHTDAKEPSEDVGENGLNT